MAAMKFPKPPPLKVKPPCPAVANKWHGVHPKHVKLTIMVSVVFWTCLIVGPFVALAFFGWPLLQGMLVLKLAVVVFLLAACYLGFSLGMLATHRIILRGHLQDALDHQARKRGRL